MTYISISEASEHCRVFLEACDVSETKTTTKTKKYKDGDKDKDKDNLVSYVTQLTIPDILRNSMLDIEGK